MVWIQECRQNLLRACCHMHIVRKRNLWLNKVEPRFLEVIEFAGPAPFQNREQEIEYVWLQSRKAEKGRKKHWLSGVLREGEFSGLCSHTFPPHLSSLSGDLLLSPPVLPRQLCPTRARLGGFLFSCQRTGLTFQLMVSLNHSSPAAAASASLQQTHHSDHLQWTLRCLVN